MTRKWFLLSAITISNLDPAFSGYYLHIRVWADNLHMHSCDFKVISFVGFQFTAQTSFLTAIRETTRRYGRGFESAKGRPMDQDMAENDRPEALLLSIV